MRAPASVMERSGRWAARMLGAGAIGAACAYTGILDPGRLASGVPNILKIVGEMFPPNLGILPGLAGPTLETIAMSVAGTSLAVAAAFPLSLLAARSTAPHPLLSAASRGLFNVLRAIPELIMGILFVAAVGFGVLPGVLALGVHSIGMLGKFFAEAIEKADPGPVEAVAATGAGRMQVILFGVLPQVSASLIDYSLYRWEYNFRASTVMGMVGAGGLGFQIVASLRILQYQDVLTCLAVVLVMVTLVDQVGGRIRARIVRP
ncbi:MAG TPA: phosphonate ABC transporter, permease protein PhnE [Candidatus Sulfotelmatobacter sp.]|nr:phosphonate ABC transporter, permease protein PhnE [Candidatus Sulfotelmatobacter sp.]